MTIAEFALFSGHVRVAGDDKLRNRWSATDGFVIEWEGREVYVCRKGSDGKTVFALASGWVTMAPVATVTAPCCYNLEGVGEVKCGKQSVIHLPQPNIGGGTGLCPEHSYLKESMEFGAKLAKAGPEGPVKQGKRK